MRIGMVLNKNYPPDIRVEKEVRALRTAGHNVHLLALARTGMNEPTEERIEGLSIRRIFPAFAKLSSLVCRWNFLRFHMTFQDRYWGGEIERYLRDFKLDALHVHDLPLVGTAIPLGRQFGIPVIADLHENYPAALQVWQGGRQGLKEWLTANQKRWSAYECQAVRDSAHVIVVVDEAKWRLIEQHGLPTEKITVVMNVEDVKSFQNIDLDPEISARYQDLFLVCYVGGGGEHRGLETTIQAMPYLRDAIPNLRLLIVGPQAADCERLGRLADAQGVKDLVEIFGWQPFTKVPSYIHSSKICLVPHHQNSHTDSTIPHKLFQYMLLGKPVVVSNCQPLKRIVEETRSGLVFQAGNPLDLAKQIRKFYLDKQLRRDCGGRGHEAVLKKYNWTIESRKLCSLYDSL
ncbi:MAG: glycosyltransferase family 4 protein [Candidatus Hodarchaeota archaeon]